MTEIDEHYAVSPSHHNKQAFKAIKLCEAIPYTNSVYFANGVCTLGHFCWAYFPLIHHQASRDCKHFHQQKGDANCPDFLHHFINCVVQRNIGQELGISDWMLYLRFRLVPRMNFHTFFVVPVPYNSILPHYCHVLCPVTILCASTIIAFQNVASL